MEPQITMGMLTDAAGFPLIVNAFEGNKTETTTMLPVIKAFMAAHGLTDVVIVADAGMISEKNMTETEAASLSFILGMRIPEVPYVIDEWRREHPGEVVPDGHVFVQPWPASRRTSARTRCGTTSSNTTGPGGRSRASTSRSARPSRPWPGRSQSSATGSSSSPTPPKIVNRELWAKARALAGIKGYATNIADPTAEQVIGAYQRLFQIEKSFRMAKSDLAARPIFHRTRDSIEAHLTIVFALAVSRWIEDTTGWSIRKFVRTARRYRTVQIQAGEHLITAADPLPDDVVQILDAIKTRAAAH